jgi:MYXO-CTERM domain-containing protein
MLASPSPTEAPLRHATARLAASSFAALALAALTTPARAVTSNFCDFTSVSALQLDGNAAQASGNILRVAPNSLYQAGSAWLKVPIALAAGTSVHTYFRFEISGGIVTGGDGLTFTLQNAGLGALGADDGALGYGSGLGNGGITPSFAVEFYTNENSFDGNPNHVALLSKGDTGTLIASAPAPVTLDGGQVVYVWIDFDGVAKQASVFVSGTAVRPPAALFTGAADLGTLGGQAYAGFTAATGLLVDNHDILEWDVSTDGSPCCTSTPGGACSGATPVCGAAGLCVASGSTTSSSSGNTTTSSTTSSGTGGTGSTGGTGGTGSTAGTGSTSSTAASSSSSAGGTGGAGGAAVGAGPMAEAAIVEGGGCSCRASSVPADARALALAALVAALAWRRARRPGR